MSSVFGGKNSNEIAGRFCPCVSAGVAVSLVTLLGSKFPGRGGADVDLRVRVQDAFNPPFGPEFVTISPLRAK
jgi:hypothetical protein